MQTDVPRTILTNDNQTDHITNPDQPHPVTPKKRRKGKTINIGRYSRSQKYKKYSPEPVATPSPKSPPVHAITPSPPKRYRRSYRPTPAISVPTPKYTSITHSLPNPSTNNEPEVIELSEFLSLCNESRNVFGRNLPKVQKLSVAYIYQHCFGAPPPEDWGGTDGTIMRLVHFFRIPLKKRRQICRIVIDVWECINSNRISL